MRHKPTDMSATSVHTTSWKSRPCLLSAIFTFASLFLCLVPSPCESKVVNIAVLLPFNDDYMFSYHKVSPAIQIAIRELPRLGVRHTLSVQYNDTKCKIAEGIDRAINFYINRKVDAFLGPVCDFALAPVGRQAGLFWKLPVISCGAMAMDFSQKSDIYQTLTRVGPVNFGSLSTMISERWDHYKWSKLKLVYSREGQDHLVKLFCHLLVEAVHYTLKDKRPDLDQDYYRMEEEKEDLAAMLRDEIGLKYGGRLTLSFS